MTDPFNQETNRFHTDSIKWDHLERLYKRSDITSMWVADSDYPAPEPVIQRLIERASHGVFGYTGTSDAFYQSFIQWVQKRHDWTIEKDWIMPAPGIVPAINWAIQALTEEGDKVIIQPPVYHPFFSAVTNNKRVLVENTLIEADGQYRMDFEGLVESIDDKTKMLILCNPHNPIGRVWTKEELTRLGQICLEHNVMIVSDEIHSDLVYPGHKHVPMASLSEAINQITITCMAPSKTFNVAGLSASVVVMANKGMAKTFKKYMNRIGMHLINVFGMEAFTACYETGETWLEDQLVHLQGNIDYFKDFIESELPDFKVVDVQGTYLLWLDARCLQMTPEEMTDFFTNQVKVALNNGSIFGETGKGFMRFNLATNRANVVAVLDRLKAAYNKL